MIDAEAEQVGQDDQEDRAQRPGGGCGSVGSAG
jgi:hypothetical protein